VLDMRMPGIDGVEVMRRAREMRPELLIIVLTGHAELESAIAAIESRAVSYLRKPVSVHDIAAAVASALQQRAEKLRLEHLLGVMDQTLRALRGLEVPGESPSAPKLERFLRVGPVTLDREKRLAVVGGTPARTVELTENETAILAYLMEHPDQVISGRELVRAALGYSDVEEREARSMLRPQIFRLRHKLEADPDEPRLIRTMRGRGYLFAC
jgi:DNA-binding response OmpR family regulator